MPSEIRLQTVEPLMEESPKFNNKEHSLLAIGSILRISRYPIDTSPTHRSHKFVKLKRAALENNHIHTPSLLV